jgi:pyruvate/2-oxoglutarate dehydrogenase complex dihydrolipoamide dehydrogenase (E3) component
MLNPNEFPQAQPYDDHNQRLIGNVHPFDWINPDPDGRCNMVVIGAGTAGLITAAGTAGLGGKAALIERGLMGGDCLNVGCVPSKALIRAARAAADVRAAGQFGVQVPDGMRIDFAAIMERMRRLRADIGQHDSAERFSGLGMDVYMGSARFTSPDTVEVDGKALKFARACIATGSRALELPIPGIADVDFLTNETVFSLTELPQRLGVIGAGPIGCELAQAFARFGSQVILIEAMHGIMPHDETRAAEVVAKVMEQDGVKLRCCGKNLLIRKQADGIHLVVDSHGSHYDEVVDRLLLAVGRTPNVEGLNLEAAGVAYDKKGVQVNERLQTANRRIYAAGDMISEITVAIAAGAGLGTIARTIHPYPPQAEAIKKAGDAYNRTRLTPRVQKIFNTLLKWRR